METEFGPVRIDAPRQESVRPEIPDPVKHPSQPARRLAKPFHPRLRHRGILWAQEDGRLKLNRHQRHLERLRRDARPEGDPRPHQQRTTGCDLLLHSGDDLRIQAGRQKSDQLKTPPRVPEIGVPHDLLEVLVRPVAERSEAGSLDRPVERPVHDDHNLVTQRGQPLPQPDEGVDVARAPGGDQNEFPLSAQSHIPCTCPGSSGRASGDKKPSRARAHRRAGVPHCFECIPSSGLSTSRTRTSGAATS